MNPPPYRLMDDHSEALIFWRESGFHNEVCLHVDAHLDLGDDTFDPLVLRQMADCPACDLANFHCPTEVPGRGFHCGNYLYPALRQGLVGHLIWVVPPPAEPLLPWLKEELPHWLDPPVSDMESLRPAENRVEGTLLGTQFTVCTSDNLPAIDGSVLLDIDLDYFFRLEDDSKWQSPQQLWQHLQPVAVKALTVATSVKGGFCPEGTTGLALELLQLYGIEPPPNYRPPEVRWQDRAHREMERGQNFVALELFRQGDPQAETTGYFQALLHLRLDDPGAALAVLERALEYPMGDVERARLESLTGAVLNLLNLPHQAEPLLRSAHSRWPTSDTQLELGRSLKAQGRIAEATGELRQALQRSCGLLSAAEIENELSAL